MEKIAPYLNTFLYISERLPEESSKREAYFPSHLLRAIADEYGLDAIEYPSVRVHPTNSEDSINLVVFGELIDLFEKSIVGEPFPIL